ncbi:FHA domain-containing protein, partial [bacterium]|nr:FHA domain-containing protein [bacterium]
MLQLVIEKGKPLDQIFELRKNAVILGRSSECDISVTFSHEISRRHARIDKEDNHLFLSDLNSSNGTRLNGRACVPGERYPLQLGDRVEIANLVRFRLEKKALPVTPRPKPAVGNTSRIFSAQELIEAVEIESGSVEKDVAEALLVVQNKSKLLQILNRVEKELIAIRPIDDYLKLVMDLVFDMLPADRGFLLMQNEKSGELESKQIKFRQNTRIDSRDLVRISSTIAEKVMQENVAIITPDAIIDDRFSEGESIFHIGIRSAMCVPLWTRDKPIGVIYVDNLMTSGSFSDDDLALLSAFANHATIGIEQSRLHEQILYETKIRIQLQRYHSPEIAERIIQKENVQLEAHEVEATILFADIVGFTPMLEEMPPSEIAELLNEFYSLATNVIFRFGGTLDKFIGDSVMAIFGAPIQQSDDAERAVKSALEMQDALHQLNTSKPDRRQFEMRVGINSGKVIAGDFGSFQRMEYTVLGDIVNLAARFESDVAQPGQIILGQRTYEQIYHKIECQSLGEYEIRGKVARTHVYQALRVLDDANI